MAVTFDASSDIYLSNATGLGTVTAMSAAIWVRINTARVRAMVWSFHPATSTIVGLGTDTFDGLALGALTGNSIMRQSRAVMAGTWYFFGVSVNTGTDSGLLVSRALDEDTFTVQTWTENTLSNINMGSERVSDPSSWLNGSVAYLKVWQAALTQSELQAEAGQAAPVRTSGLVQYISFDDNSGTDESGTGHSLSRGGSPTVEDGPTFETLVDLAESGNGADSATAAVTLAIADTGSGVDALQVSQSLTLAEAGSAAEQLEAGAAVPLADTATGASAIAVGTPIAISDPDAQAAESIAVQAAAPLAQAGSAAEVLSPAVTVPLTESATAADGLLGGALLSKQFGDAGQGVDALASAPLRDIGQAGPPRHTWSVRAPRGAWMVGPPCIRARSAAEPRRRWAVGPADHAWAARTPRRRYSAASPRM